MPTTRISESAKAKLRRLASESNETQQKIIDAALEAYRRQRFLAQLNAAFDALRRSPEAWQDELEERAAWDATLSDGLEGE